MSKTLVGRRSKSRNFSSKRPESQPSLEPPSALRGRTISASRLSVEGIFEKMAGTDKREAEIVLPRSAEGGSSDGCDSGLFEEQFLDFLRRPTSVFDIHPGVERAFGRMAPEAGNFGERWNEEITAKFVLGHHCVDSVGGVTKRFDCGNLSELGGAGESVQDEQIHGVNNVNGGNGIAEAPSGHGK